MPAKPKTLRAVMQRHPALTWGTISAIVTTLVALGGVAVWFDNHYQTAADAKEHALRDDTRALYFKSAIGQIRIDNLDDKVTDLSFKEQTGAITSAEKASLERYKQKLSSESDKARDIQRIINERTGK